MKTVTLAISSYNQLELLKPALQSALRQEVPFDEIIVVDDGSTDGSVEWLGRQAAQAPAMRVLALPENRGRSAARNAGIDAASSDYLAFLDGDDWLEPDAHAIMQGLIADGRPDLGIYCCGFFDDASATFIDAAGRNPFFSETSLDRARPRGDRERAELLRWFPSHWTKICRLEYLRQAGLRFCGHIYEDSPFHFEAILAADDIRCTRQRAVNYRMHGKSILKTTSADHMQIFDVYDRILAAVEGSDRAGPRFRAMTRRQRFNILAFVLVKSGRLPCALRPEFARRMLGLPDLTEFDLDARETETLEHIRRVAAEARQNP